MRGASWLLALLPALGGCTVTGVSDGNNPSPSNSCQRDADCDEGTCRDGVCQTLNGEIESLLVSATPPSDSVIPQLTFVARLENVPTSGGSQDLKLPGPSHVVGGFMLPKGETYYPTFDNSEAKTPILPADDGESLPVTVTLALRERLLGLPQPSLDLVVAADHRERLRVDQRHFPGFGTQFLRPQGLPPRLAGIAKRGLVPAQCGHGLRIGRRLRHVFPGHRPRLCIRLARLLGGAFHGQDVAQRTPGHEIVVVFGQGLAQQPFRRAMTPGVIKDAMIRMVKRKGMEPQISTKRCDRMSIQPP